MNNNPFDLFTIFEDTKKIEETEKEVSATSETATSDCSQESAVVVKGNKIQETDTTVIEDENQIPSDVTTDEENNDSTSTDDDSIANENEVSALENATLLFEELSKQADSDEEEKEKQNTKKKDNSNPSDKNKKSNDFNVNEFTIIRYFREEIPLTDYFTVDEIIEGVSHKKNDGTVELKKIDAEMVRARLENTFPEFVKGHTEMVYHGGKRNFIIPAIVAKKKGLGEKAQEVLSSIDDDTSFPLHKFPKKIPFRLLLEFISIAKIYGMKKLEVRAEIYYNFDTEKYLLHVPKQTVHRYWAESNEPSGYFQSLMLNQYEQYVQLVCEIHSHHVMGSNPSSIDDEAERVPGMFYAIVGQIEQNVPSVFVRTFSEKYGHVIKKIPDIFENYDCEVELPRWKPVDIKVVGVDKHEYY